MTDIFTKIFSNDTKKLTNFEPGYQESYLDIIRQKSLRSISVKKNKILDMLNVENDPNYSRSKLSSKLNGYASSLLLEYSNSHILTVINSFYKTIEGFVPVNLLSLLENLQALSNTNTNVTTKTNNILSMIENTIFSDISISYDNKTITFNDIVDTYNDVRSSISNKETFVNDILEDILGISLRDLLPNNYTSITSISPNTKVNTLFTEPYDISLDDPFYINTNEIIIDKLMSILGTDDESVRDELLQNIQYPSLMSSVKSIESNINIELYNVTEKAFAKFFTEILNTFPNVVKINSEQSSLDFLYSLKTNLKRRNEMMQRSASNESFYELDLILKQVFVNGTYTNTNITAIYNMMKDMF